MEANDFWINWLTWISVLLVLVFGDEREEESESELHAYNRYAVADQMTNEMNNH